MRISDLYFWNCSFNLYLFVFFVGNILAVLGWGMVWGEGGGGQLAL